MTQRYGMTVDYAKIWPYMREDQIAVAIEGVVEELNMGAKMQIGRFGCASVVSAKAISSTEVDIIFEFDASRVGEVRVIQ